jgi:hypothetical protein
MKIKLFAAAAVAAFGLAATAASAAEIVTITAAVGDNIPAGESLITNFDSTGGTVTNNAPGVVGAFLQGGAITSVNPLYTFSQDSDAYTRDGAAGLDSGVSAPPPGDTGYYETVLSGGSATLTSLKGMTQFSFYMGSPDTYNDVTITVVGVDGKSQMLVGPQIWCPTNPAPGSLCYGGGGDQTVGYTVTYSFSPDAVKSIQFTSTGNSFEFDTLAGISVPEPASWSLMIVGFGAAGSLLRSRRKLVAA